jgi:hypothetical protein
MRFWRVWVRHCQAIKGLANRCAVRRGPSPGYRQVDWGKSVARV